MVRLASRRVLYTVILCGLAARPAGAQEPAATTSSASVERVRAALQSPPIFIDPSLFTPAPTHRLQIGPLDFVSPDTPGEFLAIRVPIGELISRAAHSLANAQHRRAENAARREVAQVVAELQRMQQK